MKQDNHGKVFQKYKTQLAKEFFEIEENDQLTDDQKVNKMITNTSVICAAVAVQPIPFADIFILTPIQAFMGYKIGLIRKVDLKEEGSMEVLKYVGGVVGAGYAAQQTALGLYKIGLPGIGGLMAIPLVGGLTFGIGKAMDLYFRKAANGEVASKEEMLSAFHEGKKKENQISRHDVKKKVNQLNE
ncbi:hypothetical protein [Planococcus salinus]|uniref:DUF697 domain-containing protein n=1 Tax=Planococcus salinus TaxID=1848460 RepID=A0A3M8P7G0_9BACL|nr:hypothetical protein [Planococcus salinus]RNF39603.1 hypothetical protein EEX84_09020 [Planococcus salinus]